MVTFPKKVLPLPLDRVAHPARSSSISVFVDSCLHHQIRYTAEQKTLLCYPTLSAEYDNNVYASLTSDSDLCVQVKVEVLS